MANLYYKNSSAQLQFEILDANNNIVGLSSTSVVYYYIKTPDNYIYSNDPNITTNVYMNGIGSYISNPVLQDSSTGFYYVNYTFTRVGDYKYKFQISDPVNVITLAISGDAKVITDGIF